MHFLGWPHLEQKHKARESPVLEKRVKWGSSEPEHSIWALESSAIKLKVCGPKRFSISFQGLGQACNPYQTMQERASVWLRGEGTDCKQREIFWVRRVWNNSFRAWYSCLLLPPFLSQIWISARQSTWNPHDNLEELTFQLLKHWRVRGLPLVQ